jgi:hypothetical protein
MVERVIESTLSDVRNICFVYLAANFAGIGTSIQVVKRRNFYCLNGENNSIPRGVHIALKEKITRRPATSGGGKKAALFELPWRQGKLQQPLQPRSGNRVKMWH